jgi:ABC-type transporter Mla subunit MlaD
MTVDASPGDERKQSEVAYSTLAQVRPKSRDRQLSLAFLIFLASGLFGAFWGNWIIPSLSITLYFALGSVLSRQYKNTEKFADSLYYMGFLFTLWGLFIALGPLSDVETLSSSQIITQLGIKLITTVLALTFRILLIQFRETVSDQEEEARESISKLVVGLSAEVDESVKALRSARERMLSTATEGLGAVQSEVMKNVERANATYLRSTAELLTKVEGAVTDLLGRFSNLDIPQDLITRKIDESVGQIAEEVRNLREIVRSSNDAFARNVDETLNQIGVTSRKTADALMALEGLTRLTRETMDRIDQATNTTDNLAGTLERTTGAMSQFGEVIDLVKRDLRADVDKFKSEVASATAEITRAGDKATDDARRLGTTLAEGVRILRGEIERS